MDERQPDFGDAGFIAPGKVISVNPGATHCLLFYLVRQRTSSRRSRKRHLPPCRAPPGSMKKQSSCEKGGGNLSQHRVDAQVDDCWMTWGYLARCGKGLLLFTIPALSANAYQTVSAVQGSLKGSQCMRVVEAHAE
ncbi:MAG: hypothetical protein ACI8W7_002517 [Gammaproteobacteria bacterium]